VSGLGRETFGTFVCSHLFLTFNLARRSLFPFPAFPAFPSPLPPINVLDKGQSFVWFLLCVQPTATRQKNNYHWYKSAENTSMRRRAGVFTAHMLIYNIYICLIKMQQRTRCTPGFPSPVSRRTRIRDQTAGTDPSMWEGTANKQIILVI